MALPRIAIVGAGIAGLTAALTLQDAGLACTVYEAAERVGGRMHSDAATWDAGAGKGTGMVSEWCGEFIDYDHTTLHKLIHRFGLETVALERGRGARAPSLMYIGGGFYPPDEVARDFAALVPRLQQQMADAGFPTTYNHYTEEGHRLDQLSAYAWIEQYIAGGHESRLGRYLDRGCTGLYGLDTSEQSALNLVYLFAARIPTHGSTRAGPLQGSSKIEGGNARLPLAIAGSLPAECIQLGHRLVALERAGDGAGDGEADAGVALTLATAHGDVRERYDRVILALPFSTLRRVDFERAGFDARKRTAIEELGFGTISKLFMQFDQPYWYADGPWPSPHNGFFITDLDIQTLWDGSDGSSGAEALLVDYTSGQRGAAYAPPGPYTSTVDADAGAVATVQQYAHESLRQLERVFPGISAHYTGRAALSYSTGDPTLLGSYSCWRVGQYTRIGGYERVRQGPIHFAGEHCSVEFQGYMEGAAREGVRAAREIVQDVGALERG
jgi:monoamine oxidase